MEILDDPWYNKLQEDKRDLEARLAAAERRAERLAGVLQELLSVANQLPALQPGSYEFDTIELARAALADNAEGD